MEKNEDVVIPDEVPPPYGEAKEYNEYWEKADQAHDQLEEMKRQLAGSAK